jgi:hypothetical protein
MYIFNSFILKLRLSSFLSILYAVICDLYFLHRLINGDLIIKTLVLLFLLISQEMKMRSLLVVAH